MSLLIKGMYGSIFPIHKVGNNNLRVAILTGYHPYIRHLLVLSFLLNIQVATLILFHLQHTCTILRSKQFWSLLASYHIKNDRSKVMWLEIMHLAGSDDAITVQLCNVTRALRNFERDCIILVHTLKSTKCVNIVDLKVACWNM